MTTSKLLRILTSYNTPNEFVVIKEYNFINEEYKKLYEEAMNDEHNYDVKKVIIDIEGNEKLLPVIHKDVDDRLKRQCLIFAHKTTFGDIIDLIHNGDSNTLTDIKLAKDKIIKALTNKQSIVVVHNI